MRLSFEYLFSDIEQNDFNLCVLEEYYSLSVSKFIDDKIVIECLIANKIETIYELTKKENINILLALINKNSPIYSPKLLELTITPKNIYLQNIKLFINELKSKNRLYDIFLYRCGIISNYTLQDVGYMLDLTRERVRQLEKKVDEILQKHKSNLKYIIDIIADNILEDKIYITIEKINDFFDDKIELNTYLYVLNKISDTWKYSKELKIIYLNNYYELIVEDELKSIPLIISKNEHSSYSRLKKDLIAQYYSLRSNGFYIKIGVQASILYADLVDKFFPNGIKLNDENVKIISDAIIEKVPEFGGMDAHVLSSALARMDYCLIDKGTVINRKNALILPSELTYKIINFISEHKGTIFYATIFEHFKEELTLIGINNRYYLKGVLDHNLPGEFQTKRDYIIIDNTSKSSYDTIEQFIVSKQRKITFKELRENFKGVKDSVFYNFLYNRNDIVMDFDKSFITLSAINISCEFKNIIMNTIQFYLNSSDTQIISYLQVLDKIKKEYPQELENIPLINSQYMFFSFISKLFANDFNFNRPLISSINVNIENISSQSLIDNYANTLDFFDKNIIDEYIEKNCLRGLYSYLEFMIDHSSEFVQINRDAMVKINNAGIPQKAIDIIDNQLSFYLSEFFDMNLKYFSSYYLLPKIQYPWNEYFIAGIIRSFLSEKYDLFYTDSNYKITEFIVKKKLLFYI